MFSIIRNCWLFILVFCFLIGNAQATSAPTSQQIDQIFSKWNNSHSPGLSLLVIQNGQIAYQKAYGMADLKRNTPLLSSTLFDVASLSKQFTAFCIALLIEDKKITLNDDISLFFPELIGYSSQSVCIKHLIYHTSGLPEYLDFMEEHVGKTAYDRYYFTDVLNVMVKRETLKFDPGKRFEYCNTNYLLLAEIVHRVSGKTLRQFAQENIFDPLGMKNTHYHDHYLEEVPALAVGYAFSKKNGKFKTDITPLDLVGDGGVYTSVEDLFLWDQNFYHNTLGKKSQHLIDFILTPGRLTNGKQLDYAFGLNVEIYHGHRIISHEGEFVGYVSAIIRFPEQDFSVIILSNLNDVEVGDLAFTVAQLYLGIR